MEDVSRGRWIENWQPEVPEFWENVGRRVAHRNLVFSILAEHLGFSIWLIWSVVVVALPAAGFRFSVDELFWLVAVPNLVGSTARLPYTFAVARFGGRNWTVISALLLLIPAALLVVCVSNRDTPYWAFLAAAASAGFGGGNFASSMANISYFYPERMKGFMLGVNAAGGNLGVSVVQLLVPIVMGIGIGAGVHVANAGYVYVPLILVAAGCAWFFMDNLALTTAPFSDQIVVLRRRHTWVMSFLYIGTFGSFIGYSAALPLLITTQFEGVVAGHFAFLGPLLGSLSRPVGGWLSDRLGGGRVTLWVFLLMALGVLAVLGSLQLHNFPVFLATFLVLFVASGAGNGSTYRMIPAIFRVAAISAAGRITEAAVAAGRHEAAAVIGIVSAIGAYGGFMIPRGFGASIANTGRVDRALYLFIAFYAVCAAVTWWFYLRRRILARRAPSLAAERV